MSFLKLPLPLLALMVAGQITAAEPVTLVGDDWAPYNSDPAAEKPGLLVDIAQAVFASHGLKISYHLAPWTRSLKEVREGTTDILVGCTISDKDGLLLTSTSQANSPNCFYTLPKSTWTWNGPASLTGIILGVSKDYTYTDEIDAYVGAGKGILVATSEQPLLQLFKVLDAGRVEAIIDNPYVIAWKLKSLGKSAAIYRSAGDVLPVAGVYLGVSAKSPRAAELLKMIEDGMPALRADGRLAAIYARYDLPLAP